MTTSGTADFYDWTALWWGSSTPTQRDQERAERIQQINQVPMRVLELGAGFGGAAALTADLGHHVVAIERSPLRATIARRHLVRPRLGTLDVIEADFLQCDLNARFDVVAYWSGFGVGDDHTHSLILRRIRDWLSPGGRALIDVFDPGWWRAASGSERIVAGVNRRFGFDTSTQRFRITCWVGRNASDRYVETVRCYRADEFARLAADAGLELSQFCTLTASSPSPSYLVELTG